MTIPSSLQPYVTSQTLFYAALAVFLLGPLLARFVLGVTPFTIKLRLAQKFGLGTMCLLFACLPGMAFTDEYGSPAPEWAGRLTFGVMGVLRIGLGIRTVARRQKYGEWEDFDDTPS